MEKLELKEKDVLPKYLCPCGRRMKGSAHQGGQWTCEGSNHIFKVTHAGIEPRAKATTGDPTVPIRIDRPYVWNVSAADSTKATPVIVGTESS